MATPSSGKLDWLWSVALPKAHWCRWCRSALASAPQRRIFSATNRPFIDDFPIKTSIYKGFSMAMLNNQMVIGTCWLEKHKKSVNTNEKNISGWAPNSLVRSLCVFHGQFRAFGVCSLKSPYLSNMCGCISHSISLYLILSHDIPLYHPIISRYTPLHPIPSFHITHYIPLYIFSSLDISTEKHSIPPISAPK